MANIPPDILTAQAAGRIPDDVSLGYLAESRDGPAKVAIIALGCVAFITMMGRFYSRMQLAKKFGLDDYLAFLTMVFITLSLFQKRKRKRKETEKVIKEPGTKMA
jgi:hypothetical protein